MIRDVKAWTKWEAQGPLSEPADFHRNLRLVEAMYQLARALGVFERLDPFEGLDAKIRMVCILNRLPLKPAEDALNELRSQFKAQQHHCE